MAEDPQVEGDEVPHARLGVRGRIGRHAMLSCSSLLRITVGRGTGRPARFTLVSPNERERDRRAMNTPAEIIEELDMTCLAAGTVAGEVRQRIALRLANWGL